MMKTLGSSLVAAASLAAALSCANTASADFWWDTNEGQLYFDGVSGDYGVFRFLDGEGGTKKDIAIYINGMGPQYTDGIGVRPGTYDAQWFDYESSGCGRVAVDPDGNAASDWGVMWFRVDQDSDYFTAQVYDCEEQTQSGVLKGTPGTLEDAAENPRSIKDATEDCGNNSDAAARTLGCSEIISHPDATPDDISYAYWQRAYVRCRNQSAPVADIMADLMASARADPDGWKRQYDVTYNGPDEGLYPIVYETVLPWVEGTCFN